MANSYLYGQLNQKHPDYSADLLQELGDLYCGGYAISSRATKYLPKLVNEGSDVWAERCRNSAYLNYFGQIVDQFAAALFSQELSVGPAADADNPDTPGESPDKVFYSRFAHNCDLKGTPFTTLLKRIFTTAATKRRALVACDFPNLGAKPQSRADEDAVGAARAYCFEVAPEELIDWEYDEQIRTTVVLDGGGSVDFDVGKFRFCVFKRCIQERMDIASRRDRIKEQFKVWFRDGLSGVVSWELYEISYDVKQPPRDTDSVTLVGSGASTFDCIPIVEVCLPDGLWIGNKIGTVCKEHFQRRSALISGQNRALLAIPYVKQGTEAPYGQTIPSDAQQNPYRGEEGLKDARSKGFLVIGKDDEVGYLEPNGSVYTVVDNELKQLIDEIYRIVSLMAASVSNTSSAVGRSGASKAEDRNSTDVILTAYGAIVRDAAKRIYDVLSAARDEDVIWSAHGLDRFQTIDRDALIAEAVQMDQVPIPSVTWRKEYKKSIASKLVANLSAETQAVIRDEIDSGVEQDETDKQAAKLQMQPRGPLGQDPNQDQNADPFQAPQGPPGATQAPGQPPAPSGGLQQATVAQGKPGAPKPPQPAKAGAKPGQRPMAKPQAATLPPGGYQAPDPLTISQRGQSTSGIAQTVYNQLAEDFDESMLGWVLAAIWHGPLNVPIAQVDMSGRDGWLASERPDRVQFFVDRIKRGIEKPIVVVNEPNNSKLVVVDGHHRLLAYEMLGMDPLMYVGDVNGVNGPWQKLHESQRSGPSQKSDADPSVRSDAEMIQAVSKASGA